MSSLGNPAPLGLLAFGMTTAMLMYVDTGWVESDFQVLVSGYAIFLGGLGQLLVAIFEILKGSSFSFAVFGCYGAFWLGWGLTFILRKSTTSEFGDASYDSGSAAFFAQWGVLSLCFFVITLRKNVCLIVVFALLVTTFFLLAAAADTGSVNTRKTAGYFGFFTAVGAFYTGIAELINEEWGRNVLPGLAPIHTPERFTITKESIQTRISYDSRSNSLLLYFRGMQIKSSDDVQAIKEGVEEAILASNAPDNKVHVVVDYKDVVISQSIFKEYWEVVAKLEQQYYLSARRYHVSSFGTGSPAGPAGTGGAHMRKAMDVSPDEHNAPEAPKGGGKIVLETGDSFLA